MKLKITLLLAILSIASNAQNIFSDDFASYFTGIDLNGQGSWSNNTSNPGGLGASQGGGINNTKVLANPVAYTGYGNSDVSIEIKPDSDGCGRGFTPTTTGNLYLGFVINLSTTLQDSQNTNDFIRLMSGGNYNTSLRVYAVPNSGAFQIGVAKNSGTRVYSPLAYNFNQNHLVIIKYTINSGTNDDLISVYIDPTYSSGEPATTTFSSNLGTDLVNAIGIDRIGIRQQWTAMPTGKMGLISVANTWESLGFLPLYLNEFTNNTFFVESNNIKNGVLNINSTISLENAVISIYDIQGRTIETKTTSLSENENNISINSITTAGVYIVEIITDEKRFTQKIVIK